MATYTIAATEVHEEDGRECQLYIYRDNQPSRWYYRSGADGIPGTPFMSTCERTHELEYVVDGKPLTRDEYYRLMEAREGSVWGNE